MQELLCTLVTQLGIDEDQARGGAGLIFRAARAKLGDSQFESMLGSLDGVGDLLRHAPRSGASERLFGGFVRALGGSDAAIIAEVLSGFVRLDMTREQARGFLPPIIDYVRARIGRDTADALEKALRA